MKKAIAILFLCVHLLNTTPLGELCKLPILVEHYIEHKKADGDITVFEFLRMHYFNGDPKDADYDTDMKLPFKTINAHMDLLVVMEQHTPNFVLWQHNQIGSKNQKFPQTSSNFHSNHLYAIWQPPRLV
jgi:hypothetical protein